MTRELKAKVVGACLLGCVLLLLGAVCVQASPFLVCDPTSENVEEYEIEVNGVIEPGTLQQVNGQVRLHHDWATYPDGLYIIRARAGNLSGWSGWTDPLEFDKAIPGPAGGLRFEK